MSVISTVHTVSILTASSKPIDDTQRLACFHWKESKEKKEADPTNYRKPSSRCVSVPRIALEVSPPVLLAALTEAFEELQNDVMRAKINNYLEASTDGNPKMEILDSDISPAAVAAYAAEKALSGKLSKEVLALFGSVEVAERLKAALATALKYDPKKPDTAIMARVEASVKQHCDLITALASPKASMSEKIVKQLKKAVDLADDSKIKQQVIAKLDGFLQPKEVTLDIGLGE